MVDFIFGHAVVVFQNCNLYSSAILLAITVKMAVGVKRKMSLQNCIKNGSLNMDFRATACLLFAPGLADVVVPPTKLLRPVIIVFPLPSPLSITFVF